MEIAVPFALLTTREYFDFCNREELKEKNCIYFARIPSYFCHVIRIKWQIILRYLCAVSRLMLVCKPVRDKFISIPLCPGYL